MTWTITAASIEFEVSKDTILRGMRQNGLDTSSRGGDFTTKEVLAAIYGDLKHERTRRERAEADKAEIEAAIAKKTVIPREDVVTFIRQTFSPVREMIMTLAGSQAPLCNPSDSQHAFGHLQSWADMFLKHCKIHEPAEPVKEEKE